MNQQFDKAEDIYDREELMEGNPNVNSENFDGITSS